jgi:hypothetical protein
MLRDSRGRFEKMPLENQFWSKVEISGDCWFWRGARNWAGYGVFKFGKTNTPAHRVAYRLIKGQIPKGKTLDHLCRNRGCVNPDHLEPATMRENLLRSEETLASRNLAKTHCAHGHPLSGGNLLERTKNGHPIRICRECNRIKALRWFYAQKK